MNPDTAADSRRGADTGDAADGGPLDAFHLAVRSWLGETFERPTAPQREGWPAIRSGRHTHVSAPTGSGKTLATRRVPPELRACVKTG